MSSLITEDGRYSTHGAQGNWTETLKVLFWAPASLILSWGVLDPLVMHLNLQGPAPAFLTP